MATYGVAKKPKKTKNTSKNMKGNSYGGTKLQTKRQGTRAKKR